MDRDQYVEALKSKLDEWNAQISKIEKEMQAASSEAQSRYEKQLADMREHVVTAEKNFQTLAQSQAEEWEKQRDNFEKAWSDIAAGFGRAWSRFS